MSAICGIFRLNGQPVSPGELNVMNAVMRGHGPDGAQIWISGNIGFGHQMSHLTVESLHETLPMYYTDTQIGITADCRLFSRDELCEKLNVIETIALSDSYLVYLAYLKWGDQLAKHLFGEFSIAIWDNRLGKLFCITDNRLSRPLYYYRDENIFVFATEIRALHSLPEIKRMPNLAKIAYSFYSTFPGEHPQETFYANIFVQGIATILIICIRQLIQHCYWQLDNFNRKLSFGNKYEFADAFNELFIKIMHSAIRSHLPIASLLSGGLDSSSIVTIASKLLAKEDKNLIAISATLAPNYTGKEQDERYYIDLLKAHNIINEYVYDQARGPFNGKQLYEPDQPPVFYLYQAFQDVAHKYNARIILSGDGGERGPTSCAPGAFAELLANGRLPTLIREIYLHRKRYGCRVSHLLARELVRPILPEKIVSRWFPQQVLLNNPLSLIRRDFIQKYVDGSIESNYLKQCTTKANALTNQLATLKLMKDITVGGQLNFQSGSHAYFSYPLYDRRLIEFCLALPVEYKLRDGYTRYPIRGAMEKIMPHEICFRTTKKPLAVDYYERFSREIHQAKKFISNLKKTALMETIIDFEILEQVLTTQMNKNRSDNQNDFLAGALIPRTMNLINFLQSFN